MWLSVDLLAQARVTLLPALAHHWVILRCRSRTETLVGYPGSPRGGCFLTPYCKEICQIHIHPNVRQVVNPAISEMALSVDFLLPTQVRSSVFTLHIYYIIIFLIFQIMIFKLLVESPYTTSRLLKSYGIALIVS